MRLRLISTKNGIDPVASAIQANISVVLFCPYPDRSLSKFYDETATDVQRYFRENNIETNKIDFVVGVVNDLKSVVEIDSDG
jgi:hypothetical protein